MFLVQMGKQSQCIITQYIGYTAPKLHECGNLIGGKATLRFPDYVIMYPGGAISNKMTDLKIIISILKHQLSILNIDSLGLK